MVGATWFSGARLLIIAEGQWDALTFAVTAGWLGNNGAWPDSVCVIGIRGASGTNAFLEHYRQFWSRDVNCLLLCDADASGRRWFEDAESFADRLAKLCRKVVATSCAPHKDFNELYRARKVAPAQIAELLASHRMAVESGVTR